MAGFLLLVLLVFFSKGSSLEFEENDDDKLLEGDIRLNPMQRLALELYNDPTTPVVLGRGITADPNKLWPKKVPYIVSTELLNEPAAVKAIYDGIEEWHQRSCLQFVPRTNEANYIRFFKGSGCWSYVGMQGGLQNISLASGCWHRGTVAHEMGHAMGFWHEQSRPDRDQYVEIKWANIPEKKRHNFNKYNRTKIDSLGVPYDYLSVMHYSKTAFSSNGNPTIVALDPTAIQLGQRVGLSPSDAQQADLLYKCNGVKTAPVGYLAPDPMCTFDRQGDLEGFTNDQNDDFDWTQRLGKTPSGNTGPAADHTTGRWGSFMYIETSSPRVQNDTAILRSKLYPATNRRCLHFYYHMFGSHMGSLTVMYNLKDTAVDNVEWTKNGDQGDEWKYARVQLPATTSGLQIAFMGERGSGYKGDVAIDDVYFTDGECSMFCPDTSSLV